MTLRAPPRRAVSGAGRFRGARLRAWAVLAVSRALLLSADTVWAAPPECPGIAGDVVPPLAPKPLACAQSDCADGVGSALADIAVDVCALGVVAADCNRCECCRRPQVDLFAGTDVAFTGGNPANYCGVGGRGRAIGEAALCLLRDLAQPALGSPGPGVRLQRTGSLVIGNLEVRQRVGFVDFDPVLRRMRGYHAVTFCAPALGCLNDVVQPFTATLRQLSGGSGDCGDYAFLDPSWVLRVDTEQIEQNVGIKVGPITVYTPVGPVSITPSFGYEVNLEAVTAPWASGIGRQGLAGCGVAVDERNVTDAAGGVLASVLAGPSQGGWNAALGLGGRDPDPAGMVWSGAGVFPPRPDLDFTTARRALEKRPTGRFVTAAKVSFGEEYLPANLFGPPLSLEAFEIYVKSKLDAAFSSELALVLDEGNPLPVPDCDPQSFTRVQLQSALDARAEIGVTAGVLIDVALELVFDTIHFRFNPEVDVVDFQPVDEDLQTSPLAEASIDYASPPLAGPPDYTLFASFSAGPVNGRTFVDACLTQPPPPPQQPPRPPPSPAIRSTSSAWRSSPATSASTSRAR